MNKRTVGTAVPQNDSTYKGAIKFNKDGTISIKDTVQNPARALEYMVDGLQHQDKRDDFVIDMSTYGTNTLFMHNYRRGRTKVCTGCAATCTIQEIAKKNLTYLTIGDESLIKRASNLNFYEGELHNFEHAIENVRRADLYPLYKFFNIYSNREKFYKDIIFESDMMDAEDLPSNLEEAISHTSDYELETYNWQENLSYYKDLIKMLRRNNPNWK